MKPDVAMKRLAAVQTPEEFAADAWVATYARAAVAGGGQLAAARKLADRAAQHVLDVWKARAPGGDGKLLTETEGDLGAEDNDMDEEEP
jgi:hypothetical protein